MVEILLVRCDEYDLKMTLELSKLMCEVITQIFGRLSGIFDSLVSCTLGTSG